ncbi:MAG: DNA topoisomerase I, partial [bacterium]|nr:DNA topoisomerase I [bacterium]
LTLDLAVELLRRKNGEDEPLTEDPVTGRPIVLKRGRFGEYFELGQTDEEKKRKVKPRRVSLPTGFKAADVTPEIAQRLIQLPRTLGRHPETGEEITAGLGRYGPFLKHGDEYRNIESWERACDIELPEALAVLKQPKPAGRRRFGAKKTVLKELGTLDGAAGPVQILDGRYGPYVSDGKVNASVPKGTDPLSVTEEQATALLEAKRAAPAKKKGRRTKGRA